MKVGLIGRKIGMTRIYDEKGISTPVTVIDARGNVVVQRKTLDRDGYDAVQVGYHDQKEQRLSKPVAGHFKKAGVTPKKRLVEFRLDESESAEGELGIDRFSVGQFVDVIGQSKGKGFQGVMRKHNYGGQPAAHGSKMHRRTGAIGNRSTPGRVWKNMGMPGHMGDERVTVQNLQIVQVRPDDGVLLVKGAIPGANGTYVVVRPAKKKPFTPAK
ncbi:MAG: 50S ribosomal protein L3 [Verrucomicrobiia bacterium]